MASETSARRSSRLSGERSTAAYTPNGGLSKDETAFGILRQHVLESGFTLVKDPDNVMAKIWIREGKGQEEGGEGVDWVKEDGFTIKKYEKFWRREMADLDDVIVRWGHKLPAEAKAHLPKELFDDEDPVEVVRAEGDVGKAAEASIEIGKGTKRKSKSNGVAAKKKKWAVVEDSDDEDGVPAELVPSRREWYAALEGCRVKFGASGERSDVPPASSLKEAKKLAGSARDLFVRRASGCPEAASYKRLSLDPVFDRAVARVEAYVSSEAAKLKEELLEDLCLTNYKVTEEDEITEGKFTGVEEVSGRMLARIDKDKFNRNEFWQVIDEIGL